MSSDALARDEDARAAWRRRIAEESDDSVQEAALQEVILAIGRELPVTVDTLFTFTKVNPVKQFDALCYLGVQVRVATVGPPPDA